ncbi:hypothetical protein I307_05314 [Cryptococcus deuterogattii 99/473]|uniref:CMP/dCMP-type deaminase domain-containing protein n=1 Tax=Cryptococcus deuterogattii Ram5 TaxID=1296110 RepID=A0A0D0T4Y8_9TREE|nr:hypothetical protein I313_02868 [Cryptococcus deuterogattii Ram5]KIR72278.1 hypothetical protein I310_03680 [Cryptococcus deuterogattii CA1014]KIY55297.1 hypothetical protein I307_05314 [Cryptococcus deuterogattii 99/473]
MKFLSLLFATIALAYQVEIHPEYQQGLVINDVPAERRLHWMRVANEAVYAEGHPCPQAPFGTAIVNTTSDELVCVTSNKVGVTGNPAMHGEISAITHCTEVLTGKGWTPQEILAGWKDFSLYTNGEPCPMCASAIRWAGFKEVIYGTSIRTIAETTGCHRQAFPDKRIKVCSPVDNWELVVFKAGKGLAVKQSKVQEIRHDEL